MSDLPDDWTEQQVEMFTRLSRFMETNREAVCHPASQPISPEHWHTICHNAAFAAAEFLLCESLRILDTETNETLAESPDDARRH